MAARPGYVQHSLENRYRHTRSIVINTMDTGIVDVSLDGTGTEL
ncbi:MAG TPA: hypothetical protein PKK10_07920 [Woeseiaceae bacterium]|nr:hypothetical protein [Woeseiaceae bacterium]